jgi:subtilisin family serine protease
MARRQVVILSDLRAGRVLPRVKGTRPREGIGVRRRVPADPPEPRVEQAELDADEIEDARRDPRVVEVSVVMPTRLVRPWADPSPSGSDAAWGVAVVGGLSCTETGYGVTVAVLDTGVDVSHPAFAGVRSRVEDFSGMGSRDADGHGTHCAATLLGRNVDGRRIGVAPGVRDLLAGKVLGDDGVGSSMMLADGLSWALREGADVISLSLGFDFPGLVGQLADEGWPVEVATSQALEAYRQNLRLFDALMQLNRSYAPFGGGATVIAAAGNESRRDEDARFDVAASLPAASEGVLSIGAAALAPDGLRIGAFSNSGCRLSAPGVGITSACAGGGLVTLTGTSMACPHAAGVAALWWESLRERRAEVEHEMVLSRIVATARTEVFASSVDRRLCGAGLVTAP